MTRAAARRRIALVLEYDGSSFSGSQLQKRRPTVQSALETAVRKLTGEASRVAFAGRTDAGVHARGQVAAFSTKSSLSIETITRGLNAWLPEQIAVRRAVDAPPDFDPRRHAASRTYRYTVYNAPVRSPLWRDRAWHIAEPLDVSVMQRAARVLNGRHDFAAFSRLEPTTTVRHIYRCDVERESPIVTIEVQANAFLRQQMRRTAGALVDVGKRRLTLTALRALLRAARPATAGPVAPAHGLCLEHVDYPSLDLSVADPV